MTTNCEKYCSIITNGEILNFHFLVYTIHNYAFPKQNSNVKFYTPNSLYLISLQSSLRDMGDRQG